MGIGIRGFEPHIMPVMGGLAPERLLVCVPDSYRKMRPGQVWLGKAVRVFDDDVWMVSKPIVHARLKDFELWLPVAGFHREDLQLHGAPFAR